MCKKRSEVAGKLTRNVQVNNCDVDFICDTGANVSILIETTTYARFTVEKSNCQLTSADDLDIDIAGVCNLHISKQSHSINTNVLKTPKSM